MAQSNQTFSDLSKLAKSLDEQALEFVRALKEFSNDLENQLNTRRKKYKIEVRIDKMFELSDYHLDFFILTKEESIYYAFTMSVTDDFDEDEILKTLDECFKNDISQKGNQMLDQIVFIMTLELIKNCELHNSSQADALRLANLIAIYDIVGDEVLDQFKCKLYRSQIFIEKIDQTFRFRVETSRKNRSEIEVAYFDRLTDAQKHSIFIITN